MYCKSFVLLLTVTIPALAEKLNPVLPLEGKSTQFIDLYKQSVVQLYNTKNEHVAAGFVVSPLLLLSMVNAVYKPGTPIAYAWIDNAQNSIATTKTIAKDDELSKLYDIILLKLTSQTKLNVIPYPPPKARDSIAMVEDNDIVQILAPLGGGASVYQYRVRKWDDCFNLKELKKANKKREYKVYCANADDAATEINAAREVIGSPIMKGNYVVAIVSSDPKESMDVTIIHFTRIIDHLPFIKEGFKELNVQPDDNSSFASLGTTSFRAPKPQKSSSSWIDKVSPARFLSRA